MGAVSGAHLGWERMNEIADSEILETNRRTAAIKFIALALCLGLFILYGLVVG
jgi:hypothetical protein